jgi:hypothetical protein
MFARLMRAGALALGVTVLAGTGALAQSGTFKSGEFASGNWTGGAYYFNSNGRFSHCAMQVSYRSGIIMLFAIDSGYQWRMGFINDKWSLEPGRNYNVAYTIDGNRTNNISARANDRTFVIAELPATSNVFNQFRQGRLLVVFSEGERFEFQLTGTSRGLSELLQCVRNNINRVESVSRRDDPPPPRNDPPPPRNPPPANPPQDTTSVDERLEATRLVANMLATPDLRDYRLLTSSELSDPNVPQEFFRRAEVAWRGPGSIGALHVDPRPSSSTTLDGLVASVIGGDAGACRGSFASGKVPDNELPASRRVITSCRDSDQTTSIEYIFVQRPNGAIYRFATFHFNNNVQPNDSSPMRNALREVIYRN